MTHYYSNIRRNTLSRGGRTRSGKKHAAIKPAGILDFIQILASMGLTPNQFAGLTPAPLGFLSLGGGWPAADVKAMAAYYNAPLPNVTHRTVQGAVVDPTSDPDSNGENLLDLYCQWIVPWLLTGINPKIVTCTGPNSAGAMAACVANLSDVSVASCSWGGPFSQTGSSEINGDTAAINAAVQAGITWTAASGDNSADDGTDATTPDWFCCHSDVLACGGVRTVASGNSWGFSAWGDGRAGDEGGGGGIAKSIPQPSYQSGIAPPGGRVVCDLALNADPQSGLWMPANGSWVAIGGTSMAAPLCAALISVAKALRLQAGQPNIGLLHPLLYAAKATAFFDVTTGSDGYPSLAGYDIPTGNGVPNGVAFLNAIAESTVTVPTPPVVTPPPMPQPATCTPPASAPHIAAQVLSYVTQYGPAVLPYLEKAIRLSQLTHQQRVDLTAYCQCLQANP